MFDVITGEEQSMDAEDDAVFELFGRKYSEIINKQPVRKVYGRGEPPRGGAIWGVLIGWAYAHYGVFSWVPEMGSLAPFCDYDKDGSASPQEQLKWNDTELGGRAFAAWKPYDHPQLGTVEIGGFLSKVYNPTYKTYTNLMCWPGPVFDGFLEKHTRWNLYLVSMSPLVRITDVALTPGEAGYFRVTASIQNQGYLPSNVTRRAIDNHTAKPVMATITLKGAALVMGKAEQDLGHLPGDHSLPVKAEWMVKAEAAGAATAVIKVVSEKGGTDTREVSLKK